MNTSTRVMVKQVTLPVMDPYLDLPAALFVLFRSFAKRRKLVLYRRKNAASCQSALSLCCSKPGEESRLLVEKLSFHTGLAQISKKFKKCCEAQKCAACPKKCMRKEGGKKEHLPRRSMYGRCCADVRRGNHGNGNGKL